MGFLQPEQVTVHDAQQVCAIEALGRLEEHGIDRRELVSLIVQPRNLALQAMGSRPEAARRTHVCRLARQRTAGRKVTLHESCP